MDITNTTLPKQTLIAVKPANADTDDGRETSVDLPLFVVVFEFLLIIIGFIV